MKLKILSVLLLIFSVSICAQAQKEDHIWLFGSSLIDEPEDTIWGATNIDFNYSPPLIHYDPARTIDFHETNASICDEKGELLFYSNGMAVFNKEHQIMENGDSLNYGFFWESWKIEYNDTIIYAGLPIQQGGLIVPRPESENLYYLFYQEWDTFVDQITFLYFSLIDIGANEGLGGVLVKDSILISDFLETGNLSVCRHANGRDWWLLVAKIQTNEFYTFLIDPEGIHLSEIQVEGENPYDSGVGQAKFSLDGSKYAVANGITFSPNGQSVRVFDFDRCTGKLSIIADWTVDPHGLGAGIEFSPNGQYIFVNTTLYSFQYDLMEPDIPASIVTIATYDGHQKPFNSTLGPMALGPDHKIYSIPSAGSSRTMHRIEKPDKPGVESQFNQHIICLPTSNARSTPNIPNFRLGPLDGSSCDTLGIDNIPVAKFRCDRDTLDSLLIEFVDLSYFRPETWDWDFGDGEFSTEQHPIHAFPGNGEYEVCLTVSNENANDTFCKYISVGSPNSVVDINGNQVFQFYPNPVSDYIEVSLDPGYPLQSAYIELVDLMGRRVFIAPVVLPEFSISVKDLSPGMYILQLVSNGKLLASEKIMVGK